MMSSSFESTVSFFCRRQLTKEQILKGKGWTEEGFAETIGVLIICQFVFVLDLSSFNATESYNYFLFRNHHAYA